MYKLTLFYKDVIKVEYHMSYVVAYNCGMNSKVEFKVISNKYTGGV